VVADLVAEIAKDVNASAAQVALAWVLSHDLPIATIPGTRSIQRLEENWTSQDVVLSPEQLSRLAALIDDGVAGNRY